MPRTDLCAIVRPRQLLLQDQAESKASHTSKDPKTSTGGEKKKKNQLLLTPKRPTAEFARVTSALWLRPGRLHWSVKQLE